MAPTTQSSNTADETEGKKQVVFDIKKHQWRQTRRRVSVVKIQTGIRRTFSLT
jgi:hypothetical protein